MILKKSMIFLEEIINMFIQHIDGIHHYKILIFSQFLKIV